MLRNEKANRRKPGSEYSAELWKLHDSAPEEIARFGEKLDEELDDLETIIGRIVRACDLLIAQQA
ncbi:MAG: hypothetical protein V3W52_03410 [Syntrophobacteria bacterium]|jgi:hypothetical protein